MDSALESIKLLPKQAQQAYSEAKAVRFPDSYRSAENIAIAGMGGSIYVYYVLESLYKNELKLPLTKINTYGLPGSVTEKTLFIASSYSGTTEEVIYNLGKAQERGAKTVSVSVGGKTITMQQEKDLPYYAFDPKYNPSGQPRMGQGYMLFSMIAMLETLGFIDAKLDLSDLLQLEKLTSSLSEQAKMLSETLHEEIPLFVASDHLSGNAHILRNQTNETAKQFADYNTIPELNHHLMEGLKHPLSKRPTFVFIESDLYKKRVQERYAITKDVVEKNKCNVFSYVVRSHTPVMQFMEVLMWGGYLTYFLAKRYNENANAIPWVDYFKDQLGSLQVEP